MRKSWRHLPCVLLLLSLGGNTRADDGDETPAPLTAEQAADAVLEAVIADDAATVRALAEKDDPDPWLVADELCHRGKYAAAQALASAAPRPAVEALPAYVAAQRGKGPDEASRKALAAMYEAIAARNANAALAAAQGVSGPLDSVVRVRVAYVRGIALRDLRQGREATQALTGTAAAAQRMGWLRLAGSAHNAIGVGAYYGGDMPSAMAAYEASLEISKQIGDRQGAARTLGNVGFVHQRLGDLEEAHRLFTEALGIFRALGDRPGIATTLGYVGALDDRRGDFVGALLHYAEALDIHSALGNQLGLAWTLNNMGIVHRRQGDYAQALVRLSAALELFRALGSEPDVARALGNIGIAHERLGNYGVALEHQGEALTRFQGLGDKLGVARTLGNLGTLYERLGDYAAALENSEKSLRFFRELDHQPGIAGMLDNLGSVKATLGDYEGALRHYDAALELRRALDDKPGIAITLGNIGNAHERLGDLAQALARHREALELFRAIRDKAGIARTLNNIALVCQRQGDLPEALKHFDESLEIFRVLEDKRAVARALCNLGGLQRDMGEHAKAVAAYDEALGLLKMTPNADTHVRVLWGMAKVRLLDGRPADAARAAREGVSIVVDLAQDLAEGEGAGARDVFAGLFGVGIRAAALAGDTSALAWFFEQGRAGSLREALGGSRALESRVLPSVLADALATVRSAEKEALDALRRATTSGKRKAIRKARAALETAQDSLQEVISQIQREAKTAASLVLPDPDALEVMQGHLRPEEALLFYGLTDAGSVALVVRPGGARMVALAADVESAVDALLLDTAPHVRPEAVAALREHIVTPLGLAPDVKRVLVSPMGRLGYVPFALLFPDREVVYVPSGTTYGLLLDERSQRGVKVLGLGDPDYRARPSLPALPATRKEVEAIADVTLVGQAATKPGLRAAIGKQNRWRAVHLACHGLVDAARPMFSTLALTADAGSDGSLTVLEIFSMEIPADLVVLSACETGKGRIYATEGIVGLTRAFMFAGAPRVVASLWKVDDRATQALMIRFYELWSPRGGSQGLGTAAALKQAQAFVRDHPDHPEWKHPYYWAAWVLWGLPE